MSPAVAGKTEIDVHQSAAKRYMNQEDRQVQIRTLIARQSECSVEELAQQLGVSGMTVRRDLQSLADAGCVIRTHGGATLGKHATFEFSFLKRVNKNREAKAAIARAAVKLAESSRSVMLDGSTTTLAIARLLQGTSGLTVITTSLPAAAELQQKQGVEVLLPGGYVRSASPDLTGSIAEANLRMLHAEVAFLGADAIDAQGCVFTDPPDNSAVLLAMANSADRIYIAADHTKLGKTALRCFGELKQWAGLITDDRCDEAFAEQLREQGIEVIIAPAE